MLGGMIRRPCGCEYVYGKDGAMGGGSVGETSIAESWGEEVEDVPYVMGWKCDFEGGVGCIRDDEVGCVAC
jgi:hypothetical protein